MKDGTKFGGFTQVLEVWLMIAMSFTTTFSNLGTTALLIKPLGLILHYNHTLYLFGTDMYITKSLVAMQTGRLLRRIYNLLTLT
jgi:hypothetical protein